MADKKLNSNKIGMSLAATGAVLYGVCFLAVILLPQDITTSVTNSLFHSIDFSSIIVPASLNIGSFLIGLAVVSGYSYLAGFVFGTAYNALSN